MNLPNKLTLARVIAVPIFVILYVMNLKILAFLVFIAASITDLLDGKIARKYNLVTNFGKIMDPLADKILVYSAFCLMIENGLVQAWMLIVILAREFAVSGMRTVAAAEGIVVAADIFGKLKTVFQMIAVPLLILFGAFAEVHPFLDNAIFWLGEIALWISVIMTIISGINYIVKNKSVFSM
ncbi:MAG: CDP-diacylglycerol--glycerol-3-phosphate 3-phosphatidyltransferase [Clostridia bacterium]|nr:CDP-diacylglycerol--glycerol-3-phosphate 3-phosphatidyltransferase [Clostridia bacterium]